MTVLTPSNSDEPGSFPSSIETTNYLWNIRCLYGLSFFLNLTLCISVGSPFYEKYVYELGIYNEASTGSGSGWFLPKEIPTGPNSLVGLSDSVFGLTALILCLPVGILVDKFVSKRTLLCQFSGFFGFFFLILLTKSVWEDSFEILFRAMIVAGAFYELLSSSSDALFADCVMGLEKQVKKRQQQNPGQMEEQNTNFFINNQICKLFSYILGPFLCICFIKFYDQGGAMIGGNADVIGSVIIGNADTENSKTVMMNTVVANYLREHGVESSDANDPGNVSLNVSFIEELPNSNINYYSHHFRTILNASINKSNDYMLKGYTMLAGRVPDSSVSTTTAGDSTAVNGFWPFSLLHFVLTCGCLCYVPAFIFLALMRRYKRVPNKEEGLLENDGLKKIAVSNGDEAVSNGDEVTNHLSEGNDSSNLTADSWKIQTCILVSDLTSCLACGATIKFMNLYFINDHGFGPQMIAQLQMAGPIMIAIATLSFEQFSKWFGRPKVSITAQLVVAFCLFLLGFTGGEVESTGGAGGHIEYKYGAFTNDLQTWSRIPLFLIAAACSQASPAIDKAILMEHTKAGQRGRLNALLSFNGFAWKGSAFIGGYFADLTGGYLFAFKLASLVYFLSAMVYLPVVRWVKK